ncbi:MAG TPA: biopolymer transporter ExbD [Candidatus Avirikenella pullistercoris]|nr:biopolymer transporter ExbD [Candidatus Avirikenella pullistercoris]
MAIKRGSKVETSFGSASMTDLMFLLLIFFMVATTLINTNALKILLPQSTNQVNDKPTTTITVTEDLRYFIDNAPVTFAEIEPRLQAKFQGIEKPVVMLNMDKRVAVEEFAKIMNIAKDNQYSLFMMTTP